ncbi:hypothetical protein FBY14_13317 [Azospirillum brasilense]|nr:hypothetical protein FBY14_13317 [Azospirillum brasilense]
MIPAVVLTRIHNAIFVGGDRGAGKTAFMLNLNEHYRGNRKARPELYFCAPVDPTLLSDDDNFLNVVLAQVHKELREQLNKHTGAEDYWQALEAVTEALESEQTASKLTGMERLMAFRSSVSLEHRLFKYFEEACSILSCEALVVLVDDVDMSLEKAFQVLETVRRYLACPLVIPVISGDIGLYEAIVTRTFADRLGKSGNRDEPSGESADEAQRLAQEYLKKVLPVHQRTQLMSIPDLIDDVSLTIRVGEHRLSFDDLYAFLKAIIYRGTNGEESSHPPFMPQTARELVQMLLVVQRGVATEDLPIPSKTPVEAARQVCLNGDKLAMLLRAFQGYWQVKGDWAAYYRTRADLELLDTRKPSQTREQTLRDILFFDATAHPPQRSTYPLARQVEAMLRPLEQRMRDQHAGTVRPTLMAMPPFEPFDPNCIFRRDDLTGLSDDERILVDIYSHSDFYNSYQTAHLIYFGKAFELIASNLIGSVSEESLRRILRKAPYHSYFAFFPTRRLDVADWESDSDGPEDARPQADLAAAPGEMSETVAESDERDGSQETANEPKSAEASFSEKVAAWYRRHTHLAKAPPSAQLLYKAMNKAFNQFIMLKTTRPKGQNSGNRLNNDHLALINKRCKYILMNAFASFEGDANIVVKQNVAISTKGDFKQDASYRMNVAPLLSKDTYTAAIEDHPLFAAEELGADLSISAVNRRNPTAKPTQTAQLQSPSIDLSRGEKSAASRRLGSVLGIDLARQINRFSFRNETKADALLSAAMAAMEKGRDKLYPFHSILSAQFIMSEGLMGRMRDIASSIGRGHELEAFLRSLGK